MEGAILRCLAEVRLRQEKEQLTQRLIVANADLTQRIRELNALYHVGKRVTALTSMEDLLPYVVQAAVEVTNSEGGTLFLLQGTELVCRARQNNLSETIQAMNKPVHDPFAWDAIRQGNPVTLTAEDLAARRKVDNSLPASILYVPIMIANRVIGALGVHHLDPERSFRKQDGAMLSALSDYVAIAIENASNFAELKRYKDIYQQSKNNKQG
jgi:two-component system NtrC family sensor kinase